MRLDAVPSRVEPQIMRANFNEERFMNRKLICSAVALACLGAAGSLYAQDKQQAITTVVKITGIATPNTT